MLLGESQKFWQPRHAAIVVHHFADDAGGRQSGESRDVDRSFGMARADQHAAVARDQRENVTRRHNVERGFRRINGDRDGVRAVLSRDARGDPFTRLDRHGEGSAVA